MAFDDGTDRTFTIDASWCLVSPDDASAPLVPDAMRAIHSFVGHVLSTKPGRSETARRRMLSLPPEARQERSSAGGRKRWENTTPEDRKAFAAAGQAARAAKLAAKIEAAGAEARAAVLAELGAGAPGEPNVDRIRVEPAPAPANPYPMPATLTCQMCFGSGLEPPDEDDERAPCGVCAGRGRIDTGAPAVTAAP